MGDALMMRLRPHLFCLSIVEHVLLHDAGIGISGERILSFIVFFDDTVYPHIDRGTI